MMSILLVMPKITTTAKNASKKSVLSVRIVTPDSDTKKTCVKLMVTTIVMNVLMTIGQ